MRVSALSLANFSGSAVRASLAAVSAAVLASASLASVAVFFWPASSWSLVALPTWVDCLFISCASRLRSFFSLLGPSSAASACFFAAWSFMYFLRSSIRLPMS